MIQDWGGFGKKVPFIATLFIMTAMASSGLPGFGNFIGEMMILLGAWDKYRLQTVLAVLGLVVTAGYSLTMVRATMQGPVSAHGKDLRDAVGLQKLPYILLIGGLLLVGFLPSVIMPSIVSGTKPILERFSHER
jgi:NADH-quinone oxidoreductase subunit M